MPCTKTVSSPSGPGHLQPCHRYRGYHELHALKSLLHQSGAFALLKNTHLQQLLLYHQYHLAVNYHKYPYLYQTYQRYQLFQVLGLCEQLNPRHSIYQLSKIIDWESLENDFTRLYSRRGRPAKPVRLMISLLLLKQLHDLSDDQVVEGWIENPYWQFLSGEKELQWSAPVALLDVTHFLLNHNTFILSK